MLDIKSLETMGEAIEKIQADIIAQKVVSFALVWGSEREDEKYVINWAVGGGKEALINSIATLSDKIKEQLD